MEFGPFPSIDTYIAPRPLMLADVPEAERRPRARMIEIANGYFETLELNDGTLHTEFTDDCDRVENGLQTTNNPAKPLGDRSPRWAAPSSSGSATTATTTACAPAVSRWSTRSRASCSPRASSTTPARSVDVTWTDG